MLIDHVNAVLLNHEPNALWFIGRVAYPLFAIILVCHIQRGVRSSKYLGTLAVTGLIAQPFYMMALQAGSANVVFTLALAALAAMLLRDRSSILQHVVLGAGAFALFGLGISLREYLDFGLAGVLFPVALYLALDRSRFHWLWVVAFGVGLNWYLPNPWQFYPLTVALLAGLGTVLSVLIAAQFGSRPRFLPKYSLHIFYPAHLLLLGMIHDKIIKP